MGQVNQLKDFTRGQLDAALMGFGRDTGMSTGDGIRAFLRGELTVVSSQSNWREKGNVIYFSITSDGTTGEEWITRLTEKGFCLDKNVCEILQSSAFRPTRGVRTEVAVLKGALLFDGHRFTKNICEKANELGFSRLSIEAACLIRESVSDSMMEKMGLSSIVTMSHCARSPLLGSYRHGGGQQLCSYVGDPKKTWLLVDGHAFSKSSSI